MVEVVSVAVVFSVPFEKSDMKLYHSSIRQLHKARELSWYSNSS